MRKTFTHIEFCAVFLKTGFSAFGGWSTTAVLLEEELVIGRNILKKQDIRASVTFAQILPGATQVAIVSGVGYKLKGAAGSLLATCCYLLPALCMITGFAAVYFAYLEGVDAKQYFNGLFPALGGIILANAYKIGKSNADVHILWFVVAAAGVARYAYSVHPGLLILAGGLMMLILQKAVPRKGRSE